MFQTVGDCGVRKSTVPLVTTKSEASKPLIGLLKVIVIGMSVLLVGLVWVVESVIVGPVVSWSVTETNGRSMSCRYCP